MEWLNKSKQGEGAAEVQGLTTSLHIEQSQAVLTSKQPTKAVLAGDHGATARASAASAPVSAAVPSAAPVQRTALWEKALKREKANRGDGDGSLPDEAYALAQTFPSLREAYAVAMSHVAYADLLEFCDDSVLYVLGCICEIWMCSRLFWIEAWAHYIRQERLPRIMRGDRVDWFSDYREGRRAMRDADFNRKAVQLVFELNPTLLDNIDDLLERVDYEKSTAKLVYRDHA